VVAETNAVTCFVIFLASIEQRFSNFFDYGPLFSSGIVGGPPHLLQ